MSKQEPMSVLTIQTTASGVKVRKLTEYSDRDKALIGHYGGMRASINDTNVVEIVSEVIKDDGNVYKCERWKADEEPEETEESEGTEA